MALYAIVSLMAVASASSLSLFTRNNPPQPPCVYPYTKFVYSGCFTDAVSSRALPFQAEIEFNNATVEQCTAYCKGNNYRYAGLEYHGQCFCGTSVSAPLAPEEDCNLPCNGDPTQACGGQDRLSIYQDPTFTDADDIAISDDYMSIGCYTEGTSGRSLDYSQWDYLNVSAMTTETCLTACGAKGFPFAGTEFGRECYCGVVLGNGTVAADAGKCATPCTGNSTQFCGGEDHLSLYVAKNLQSTDPCEPPIISSSSISSATPTPSSSSSISSSSVIPTSSSNSSSSATPSSSSKTYPPTTTPSPTSSKKSSSSSSTKPTTSVCVGYHCPETSTSKKPSSSAKPTSSVCVGYHCPKTSTSTKPSSSAKPTSSVCVGYHCPKTSTSKTPKPTSTPKSTSKKPSSSKKSTLKTTTTGKHTSKSSVKPTSTPGYGYGDPWW